MIAGFVKKANTLQEKLAPPTIVTVEPDEPDEEKGWNWEDNDNVKYCRICDSKFEFAPLPPVKRLWKHHCRECGGVVCENCLLYPETGRKTCLGCHLGETPGEAIQNEIQRLLENDEARRQKPTNTQGKLKSKLGNMKNALSIAKDGTAIPQSLSLPDVPGARRVVLQRGYRYGENGSTLPSDTTSFPLSGYFEFANKSDEFCAVKLLFPGHDTLFECARPCYLTVPPTGAVHFLFDPSLEELDLLVLYENVYPVDHDAPIRYDTTARGADKSKMSPCAAVSNFTHALLVRIPCKDKNVLLKYKGLGLVQPRHGGSVTRVGLLGRLQGKRFGDDVLDYSTNVETIDTRIIV